LIPEDCVFCQIVTKNIASEIEYEDDDLMAFRDINPQAPVHILIVPKKHITDLTSFEDADIHLLEKMSRVARDLAKKMELNTQGFRLVINEGKDAGQSIFHIHFHLLGGRRLMWPPG
jgi:histidine triad (HIT) family protein